MHSCTEEASSQDLRRIPATEWIDLQDAETFRHLTYPAVWPMIQDRSRNLKLVGIRAAERPVGLAVGAAGPRRDFELLSIFVEPFFRRQGFGTALLNAMEAMFHADGTRTGVVQTTSLGTRDHIRFLFGRGWRLASVDSVLCRSTLDLARQTPWLMTARWRPGFTVSRWADLTPAQTERVRQHAGSGLHPTLNPFRHLDGYETSCSVALMLHAEFQEPEVAGWVITHLLDRQTLRWTCAYVDPRLQRVAAILPLWRDVACRQALLSNIPNFIFSVSMDARPMVRFVQRRMKPWLSDLAYACTIIKAL